MQAYRFNAACDWRLTISVRDEKRDWEGLESKLSSGKLLEQAAIEAGIPIEEARTWLSARRDNHPYDDDTLRILAAESLVTGLHALMEIAKEREGRIKAEGGEFGRTFEFHDTDAAKALVQAGLKMKSLLGVTKVTTAAKDLFDLATSSWEFPEAK